jgi:hypothetical protein
MNDHDEIVDKFWAKLRRADLDQSRLEFGLEARVMAKIRVARQRNSFSLLELASRFCLVSFCFVALLAVYLPTQVQASNEETLVDSLVSNVNGGSNDDLGSFYLSDKTEGQK